MGDSQFVAAESEFGRVLLQQGLATPGQVKECLAELRHLEASGSTPVPRLLALLAQKGYLDLPRAEATLLATPATSGPASTPSSVALPEEASRALASRENVVGNYVRVARLGAGGMGEVWRAWDRDLGRWVALKFLKGDNPNELARFQREAQTSARLSHPNITAVYGVGEDAGRPFIAMQLIQGTTLAALRKAGRRQIAELVRDAALAVHYAHQQGIIHRDLKPQNIMVEGALDPRAKRGSPGLRVFVMDFGLAKQTKTDSALSVSGSILGTPSYMSPEQARGRQNLVDARSDVYSLGATLYDLLVHQPPFKATEAYELLRQVVDAEPKPLRALDPRIDEDLETIVTKCLEKERVRRYATAADLAKDLQRYLDGEPILARPTSVAYRVRKRIVKNAALSAAIAAAVLIALGAVAVFVVGSLRRSAQREGELAAIQSRAAALLQEAGEKHARKDWAGALESLGQYLAIKPGDARAQGLKADCDRALKEQQKSAVLRTVVEEASEMSRRASENIKEAKALLRVRASRREQWEKLLQEAIEIGDSALKKYPDLAGSHYTMGEILMARNRWREAIESFDRAVALDATLAEAWRRRGLCFMELFAEAILMSMATRGEVWVVSGSSPARRAILDPLRASALGNFEKHAGLRNLEPAKTLEVRTLRAAVLMSEGRYAEGEAACDRLLEEIRTEERIWLVKALAQHVQGRYADALATMNTLLSDVVPHDARAYLLRSWTHGQLGDWKSAMTDVNRSIEIDPKVGHSYLVRASVRVQGLDLNGALKDLAKGIELDPKNPYGYSGRAYANIMLFKNWKAAVEDATRSLELNPHQSYSHWLRGTAKLNLDDLPGADADFTRAMELEPNDLATLRQFIAVRVRRDDRDGAIKVLDGLIDLAPKEAVLYHHRARLRADAGGHTDALPDFDMAVGLAPKVGAYRLDRGRSKAAREDWEGAEEDFARAAALQPKSGAPHVLLGDARLKRGDAEGALKAYNEAVRLDPKDAVAVAARGKAHLGRKDHARALKDFEQALSLKSDLEAALAPLIEECRKNLPKE